MFCRKLHLLEFFYELLLSFQPLLQFLSLLVGDSISIFSDNRCSPINSDSNRRTRIPRVPPRYSYTTRGDPGNTRSAHRANPSHHRGHPEPPRDGTPGRFRIRLGAPPYPRGRSHTPGRRIRCRRPAGTGIRRGIGSPRSRPIARRRTPRHRSAPGAFHGCRSWPPADEKSRNDRRSPPWS